MNLLSIPRPPSTLTKVLGEEGVGFGEGEEKPFSRRVLLPLHNLHFTPLPLRAADAGVDAVDDDG
ncbi:hypothetical protein, partial [Bilophila wadsworthia]